MWFWIQTFIEEHHFPFVEFILLFFLILFWSIINRLMRIEKKIDGSWWNS